METRRGFLRSMMGMGSAALGAVAIGVDTAKLGAESSTAFNFTCSCGANLVAGVPKLVGSHVEIECDCGSRLDLEWCGDHFKTKMRRG